MATEIGCNTGVHVSQQWSHARLATGMTRRALGKQLDHNEEIYRYVAFSCLTAEELGQHSGTS